MLELVPTTTLIPQGMMKPEVGKADETVIVVVGVH